ncbi:MAG: choice-of-anchor H family protein [Candidatus Krumholzibacteria bacterium]|nr:choice-of-anchor H family protein [Candidatus Krumholzibacteria bacterium]
MSDRTAALIVLCLAFTCAGGCLDDDCVCPEPDTPHIKVVPGALAFNAVAGGELPPPQEIQILNTGGGVLLWELTTVEDWTGLDPTSGTSVPGCTLESMRARVSVNTTDLPPGVYESLVRVHGCSADNSPVNVQVTYTLFALDPAFAIEDAWWRDLVDEDGDGYAERGTLVFDPDMNDGTIRTVSAQIFYREICAGDWTHYATTPCAEIVGDGEADTVSVIVDHLPEGTYEFSIVLYECGRSGIVAARGRVDDQDLRGRRFETLVTFSVYDAWWSGEVDNDGDGCREAGRLWWDVDVDDDAPHLVQAHVYCRPVGEDAWTWYHSTPCWTVSGKSEADARYVDVYGLEPKRYEFIIDVYECDGYGKAAERSFANDSDLADQCFDEPYLAAYVIADAWWEAVVDADGDGYAERRTLTWDVDLGAGLRTAEVNARVYRRPAGGGDWSYYFSTACWTVDGVGSHDTYRVPLIGLGPACWDLRIEIFVCGETDPVASRDTDDDDLSDQCFEPAS